MSWQTAILAYSIVAWVTIVILAIGEISAVRRDELAGAVATALLWPVAVRILLGFLLFAPRRQRRILLRGDRIA